MIEGILYHITRYDKVNDSIVYSFDLSKEKSSKINISFENQGGYDSSLTYYPNLNCLMTVNSGKIYKYKIEQINPKEIQKEEEIINEEGLEEDAIQTVMQEGKCSRLAAVKALRAHNGDPVEALLDVGN